MVKALIIDGKKESGKIEDVVNPFDGKTVGQIVSATAGQVNRAIDSSFNAFKEFRKTKVEDRREMLLQLSEWIFKNKKVLSETMCKESGKPIKTCESEVKGSATRLNVAASEVFFVKGETMRTKGTKATVFREPIGVVSSIGPFNYPLFAVISKIAPAIAIGNTSVAKPASDDPLAFMKFAEGVQEFLPPGVLNAVTGRGSTAGAPMVTNDKVRMIAFTGSYDTGRWISQNAGLKKLQLELGGKAPAIVLEDAKLGNAAKEIVEGSLGLSGQRCNAISIVVAHEDIKEDLTQLIMAEVSKKKLGNPMHETTDMGPLINGAAVKRVKGLVDDAVSAGAVPLTDIKIEGNMVHPVVLDNVHESMRVAYEETFGPIIPIMQFRDVEWLVNHFNALPYRLDSSIFSDSAEDIFNIAYHLDEGSIHINGAPFHSLGVFPYGEAPGAGMGREGLLQTMNEMSTLKTLVWRA